jgi:thiamine phosphate synthase YjbQ (UPF0047 family)
MLKPVHIQTPPGETLVDITAAVREAVPSILLYAFDGPRERRVQVKVNAG